MMKQNVIAIDALFIWCLLWLPDDGAFLEAE